MHPLKGKNDLERYADVRELSLLIQIGSRLQQQREIALFGGENIGFREGMLARRRIREKREHRLHSQHNDSIINPNLLFALNFSLN